MGYLHSLLHILYKNFIISVAFLWHVISVLFDLVKFHVTLIYYDGRQLPTTLLVVFDLLQQLTV